MSETLFSVVRRRFNDRARDQIALALWFSVLAGVLFLSTAGQSVSITAGLMLQLTGAYSTFVLCGKAERGPFVHIVPCAFALAGMAFLCLAPNFRNAVQASLAFLAVTILMHSSVVYGLRKNPAETAEPVCAGAD
jgi:hypothetical protein